jgi:hypothetical protein
MFELIDTNKPIDGLVQQSQFYTSQDTSKNWQRIAWAFLKVNIFLIKILFGVKYFMNLFLGCWI